LESSRKTRQAASDELNFRKVSDIDIAKRDVKERGFALSIVKDRETLFQSKTPGIFVLVTAIDKERSRFKGASAADKILGKAVAMLLIYSGIKRVYASTASQDALATLEKFKIPFEFGVTVPKILNRDRTSTCQFESLVRDAQTPEEAFEKLKICKVSG